MILVEEKQKDDFVKKALTGRTSALYIEEVFVNFKKRKYFRNTTAKLTVNGKCWIEIMILPSNLFLSSCDQWIFEYNLPHWVIVKRESLFCWEVISGVRFRGPILGGLRGYAHTEEGTCPWNHVVEIIPKLRGTYKGRRPAAGDPARAA